MSANVVLHDASGQPVDDAVTGSDGLATFAGVSAGDAITVLGSAGTAVYLRSVLAVKPGDALTIPLPGTATPLPSPAAIATPSAHFPTYPSAAGYAIQTGCSYSIVFSTSGNLTQVYPACANASLFPEQR